MLSKFTNDEIRRKVDIMLVTSLCKFHLEHKAICGEIWLIFQVSSGGGCVILISYIVAH